VNDGVVLLSMPRAHVACGRRASVCYQSGGLLSEERLPADARLAQSIVHVQRFQDEFAGTHKRGRILGIEFEIFREIGRGLLQAFDVRVVLEHGLRGNLIADLQRDAPFELHRDFVVEVQIRVLGEDGFDRFTEDRVNELVFGIVALGKHQFEFDSRTGGDEGKVIDTDDDFPLVEQNAAALGRRHDVFGVGDRAADRDARRLIDVRAAAGLTHKFLDDFVNVGWDEHRRRRDRSTHSV